VQVIGRAKTIKLKNVKKVEESKAEELYGLDIEFLKELDLGDMIDDVNKNR